MSTGLVTTVDYLDYETKTTYLMNVSATDQAPPFHRGFCSVYVTLLNELDEAVAFLSAGYEAALRENIATGTEVVQVRAQSADNLNQLTYRFDPDTSPAALALFKIDSVTVRAGGYRTLQRLRSFGASRSDLIKQRIHLLLSRLSSFARFSSLNVHRGGDECACVVFQGRITVTGLLDRERGDVYTLTVVADDGGPKKDSTVVRLIRNFTFIDRRRGSCSAVLNLKAFLFCSLHPSLDLAEGKTPFFYCRVRTVWAAFERKLGARRTSARLPLTASLNRFQSPF